jgi:hypothetical protein
MNYKHFADLPQHRLQIAGAVLDPAQGVDHGLVVDLNVDHGLYSTARGKDVSDVSWGTALPGIRALPAQVRMTSVINTIARFLFPVLASNTAR